MRGCTQGTSMLYSFLDHLGRAIEISPASQDLGSFTWYWSTWVWVVLPLIVANSLAHKLVEACCESTISSIMRSILQMVRQQLQYFVSSFVDHSLGSWQLSKWFWDNNHSDNHSVNSCQERMHCQITSSSWALRPSELQADSLHLNFVLPNFSSAKPVLSAVER